jgi:hypothetical protein
VQFNPMEFRSFLRLHSIISRSTSSETIQRQRTSWLPLGGERNRQSFANGEGTRQSYWAMKRWLTVTIRIALLPESATEHCQNTKHTNSSMESLKGSPIERPITRYDRQMFGVIRLQCS